MAALVKARELAAASTRLQALRLSAERAIAARWLVYDRDPRERVKQEKDAHLFDMLKAVRELRVPVRPDSKETR